MNKTVMEQIALEPSRTSSSLPETPNRDEEALLLLHKVAQDRDQDAYEKLFQLFEAPAFNLSLRITGNRSLAEEAVQEAMLRIWRSAHTFHWDGSVRSWIFCIVANQSLRMVQKQRREQNKMKAWTPLQKEFHSSNAASRPEHAEQVSALRQILDGLPQSQRQLLALAHGAGMTHAEIASSLSMPRRTVSKNIQRALDTLRAALAQAGVTALTPALLSAHLQEALCSGEPVTPGLCSKTLPRLGESGIEASQRLAASSFHGSSKLLVGVIGVSAALLAGGGIWWANHHAAPPQEVSTPKASIVEPSLQKVATAEQPQRVQQPQLPAENWQPFPTEPQERFFLDLSKTVEDPAQKINLGGLYPGTGSGQWTLSKGTGGVSVQQVKQDLADLSIIILGHSMEGAWEVKGFVDFTGSELGKFATPAICYSMKGEVRIRTRGKFQGSPQKALFRMWVRPVKGGFAVICHLEDSSGKQFGPDLSTIPSDEGKYRLGFGSQTKVAFTDLRMRRLPDGWTPETDPEIQSLLKPSNER